MVGFPRATTDVFRFAGNVCCEGFSRVVKRAFDAGGHGLLLGGVFGLPLVPIALVGAYLHFVYEERFNENLLFDLVAQRPRTWTQVPEWAA
jgi:hypothetical protein